MVAWLHPAGSGPGRKGDGFPGHEAREEPGSVLFSGFMGHWGHGFRAFHCSPSGSLPALIRLSPIWHIVGWPPIPLHAAPCPWLPADLDYSPLHTLSFIAREKLQAVRPETLAQAARIPSVTSADIEALRLHLELQRRRGSAARVPAAPPTGRERARRGGGCVGSGEAGCLQQCHSRG